MPVYIFKLFSLAALRLDGQKGTDGREAVFLKPFATMPLDIV